MKKIILLLIVLVSFWNDSMAQQDPQYSMYMFNGLYHNPAYAGSKDALDVSALYRNQWTGQFNGGAPQSATLSLHSPLAKKQLSLGLMVGYDHIGYTDTYSMLGMFAYKIPIKNVQLSIGLQGGFYNFSDNKNNAITLDPNDRILGVGDVVFAPNFGAGIYAYSKRFYAGISMPHILESNILDKYHIAGNDETFSKLYRHLFATAGVVIGREDATVKFKPSILIKWVSGVPKSIPSIDLNFSALFVDRFWLGISARSGGNIKGPYISDIVGMFEVLITQQLRAGYSYDWQTSSLNQVTKGSHEFMIGYTFGYTKNRFVNVRYGTYF
ncbi:MAG: PorP/SprF family type IX secretion system membrane protein [Chitinophagales bacterium]